jgi:hypothetical protein
MTVGAGVVCDLGVAAVLAACDMAAERRLVLRPRRRLEQKGDLRWFALAATSSEPVPVVAQMDVLQLRRGLRGLPHRR